MDGKIVNNNKSNPNFIFVGGIPRSGTTLVQKILDNHPEILGGSEFHHLPEIVDLRNIIQRSVDIEHMTDYFDKAELDTMMVQFINQLLLNKYDIGDKTYFSEKTPMNIFVFKELMELYPQAKFIIVIRDPRAIIGSMKSVKERYLKNGTRSIPYFVKSVKNSARYIEEAFENSMAFYEANTDRFLLVKYKDLIMKPVEVTKTMCEFLQLEWHQELLEVGVKKDKNPIVDGFWYTEEQYNRNIDTSSLEKWRRDLTEKEIDFINNYFADNPTFQKYGYYFKTNYLSYTLFKALHHIKTLFTNGMNKIIKILHLQGILSKLTNYFRVEVLR